MHYGGGDLFDGGVRSVHERYAHGAESIFRLAYFITNLIGRCIVAIRAAVVTNLLQTCRFNC